MLMMMMKETISEFIKPQTNLTFFLAFLLIATLFLMKNSISSYSQNNLHPNPSSIKPLPGPKGLPIIGNLLSIPSQRPWIKLTEWSQEFGPIYRLKLGFTTLVVISSPAIAIELLEKRSSIYSSRPRHIMTSEHVSRGLRMTFMPYNDLWRRERKLLHQLTQPRVASTYEPIQLQESAQLVLDLINHPTQHWSHALRYAGSTVLQIAFNRRALNHQDSAIIRMRKCNEEMVRTVVPGAYLVDSLPILNHLPHFLSPWKRHASNLFNSTFNLFSELYREVDLKNGTDCLLKDEYGLSDEESIFLAGAMFGAGSDTTADVIETFIFCMTLYPELAKKAQIELDEIVGQERLPDFEDQEKLKYCQALIREVMRWRTVIAGGLAHMVTEDDVYEGYQISKGSSILANHWALHLDPETYDDPERFNPDRFLDPQTKELIGTQWSEKGHHSFGFGRRICPGIHIAERSVYITSIRILWSIEV
ncbi:putative cytochrome P450 monooxygenase [Melampsora americana]|nr:putative cytochrome P450 monooxygenase [Melampsora americana]